MSSDASSIIRGAIERERRALRLVGLAFPVIRVRFAGPTDHRGARWIASYHGVRFVQPFHVGPEGPSELAGRAAYCCWRKYVNSRGADMVDDGPRLMIPGDAGPDEYAYLAVPERFLQSPEPSAPDHATAAMDAIERCLP